MNTIHQFDPKIQLYGQWTVEFRIRSKVTKTHMDTFTYTSSIVDKGLVTNYGGEATTSVLPPPPPPDRVTCFAHPLLKGGKFVWSLLLYG